MHQEHNTKQQGPMSFLNSFSPMQTFVFGIVGGVMILCTIGFFILLGVILNGGGLSVANTDGERVPPTAGVPSAPTAPTPSKTVKIEPPIDNKADHIRGNINAKVTIVEYSDFECPFCSRFHPTMQQVLADYGDDVRWVYRHFPLESIHPTARKRSLASECAADQGKFWEYTDLLFERFEDAGSDPVLSEIASTVGLNVGEFTSCLNDKKFDAEVQSDIQAASAAGCTGTPCSIVVGPDGSTTPINGAFPLDRVKALVDPLL